MYDIALRIRYSHISQHCVIRFRSAYHKCMKMFFGYSRRESITQILLITGLPSFTTILHNAKQVFKQWIESCSNSLILMFSSLQAGCVGCMWLLSSSIFPVLFFFSVYSASHSSVCCVLWVFTWNKMIDWLINQSPSSCNYFSPDEGLGGMGASTKFGRGF